MPLFPHVTKVHFVNARHPFARRLFDVAADLWSGDEMPDWRENEYARGQVETIMDLVRVIPDPTTGYDLELDGEDFKDRIRDLVNHAGEGQAAFDSALERYGLL